MECFSTFSAPERSQIGSLARRGAGGGSTLSATAESLNEDRARKVLPLVAQILGPEFGQRRTAMKIGLKAGKRTRC
jgi:hypothetical protein